MDNEIDIDKLFDDEKNLRPLSEGLGFHHSLKKEKEIKIELNKKSSINITKERAKKVAKSSTLHARSFAQNAKMGDLSAFYQENTKTDQNNFFSQENLKAIPDIGHHEEVVTNDVGLNYRIFAFLIDVIVLSILFFTIVAASFLASGLPINVFVSAFMQKGFILEGVVLYSMIFIFYFSFLDKTSFSTLGKNTLGIKLSSINKKLGLSHTFFRSLLTLINLPLLGLFNATGLIDTLTKTEVQKSYE